MLNAQDKPVKILFDVTSRDTLTHKAAIRHVVGMASTYSDSHFEVVVYGPAIKMLLKSESTVETPIATALMNRNVTIAVCAVALKRGNIELDQLLPGITVVPDGIMEIATKQGEGWGCIKQSLH